MKHCSLEALEALTSVEALSVQLLLEVPVWLVLFLTFPLKGFFFYLPLVTFFPSISPCCFVVVFFSLMFIPDFFLPHLVQECD